MDYPYPPDTQLLRQIVGQWLAYNLDELASETFPQVTTMPYRYLDVPD